MEILDYARQGDVENVSRLLQASEEAGADVPGDVLDCALLSLA
jgi:hypothetical protein